MCLRHTTRTKDGKTHVYWRLVRSVRRGRKVVQETVAQLGELDAEGRARAAVLGRKISGRARSQGNSRESPPPMSCCPWPTAQHANFAFAAWCVQIAA